MFRQILISQYCHWGKKNEILCFRLKQIDVFHGMTELKVHQRLTYDASLYQFMTLQQLWQIWDGWFILPFFMLKLPGSITSPMQNSVFPLEFNSLPRILRMLLQQRFMTEVVQQKQCQDEPVNLQLLGRTIVSE